MSTHPNTPFYCGTQRFDWKCYNCEFCTKRYDETARTWRCDLERLIDEAYMDDGSVSAVTAKRMGEPDGCRVYNWRCPEFSEDASQRNRVEAAKQAREAERQAYENRNRPAPWILDWAKAKGIAL
jgi:hypothetical protein